MKRIDAVVRRSTLNEARHRIYDLGVSGITAMQVSGFDRQKSRIKAYRGMEHAAELSPELLISIVVPEDLAEKILDAICKAGRTVAIEADKKILKEGDFVIDQKLRFVSVRGARIQLTPKEYDLLLYLLRNAGLVLKHRTILDAVWGKNAVQQNEYLHVFIGQLRKKIEPSPTSPRYILTEPWIGYRFHPYSG